LLAPRADVLVHAVGLRPRLAARGPVGDMGELAPARRGPVLPRDLLEPAARSVLAALPGHRAATAEEIALGTPTTRDEAIARLYELRALGYVERHGDGWKLTRQAVMSVRTGRGPC
ncbi:hypothetical protein ACWDZ8_30420, partial [Streptomyces sp. NPDC003233]